MADLAYSPEEDSIILAMRKLGRTYGDIAKALSGRTRDSVCARHARLMADKPKQEFAVRRASEIVNDNNGLATNATAERDAAARGSRALLLATIAYMRRNHPGSDVARLVA